MEDRTLEITVRYANDLNKVNLISKMDVYTVVSISGGDKKNSKRKVKTPVDRDGGSNPTWDFPIKFKVKEEALQQNLLTLDFKLVCERALGDKEVGEVHVPVKELLDSPAKGGAEGMTFVCYQVTKPCGRPKGQLTFSYKFSDKTTFAAPVAEVCGEPAAAYPPVAPEGCPPPPLYPVIEAAGGVGGHYPPPAAYLATGWWHPPPYEYGYPPPAPGYVYPPPPPLPPLYPPVEQAATKNKLETRLLLDLLMP